MSANSFGGLFGPFQVINRYSCDLTIRLLQLRLFGISSICGGIEEKVKERPTEGALSEIFPWADSIVVQIKKASKKAGDKNRELRLVTFSWEVVDGAASDESEMGKLVFCDATTTRFVIVEPMDCPCVHHLLDVKRLANTLFNLLLFLGYGPQYVKYVGVHPLSPVVPHDMLQDLMNDDISPGTSSDMSPRQLWGRIDESSMVPAISVDVLEKVEKLLSQDQFALETVNKARALVGLTRDEAMSRVVGRFKASFDGSADLFSLRDQEKIFKICRVCDAETGPNGVPVMTCSRCKKVYYCSRECQKKHWPVHKKFCTNAAGEKICQDPDNIDDILKLFKKKTQH
jgi:hypothetical protein